MEAEAERASGPRWQAQRRYWQRKCSLSWPARCARRPSCTATHRVVGVGRPACAGDRMRVGVWVYGLRRWRRRRLRRRGDNASLGPGVGLPGTARRPQQAATLRAPTRPRPAGTRGAACNRAHSPVEGQCHRKRHGWWGKRPEGAERQSGESTTEPASPDGMNACDRAAIVLASLQPETSVQPKRHIRRVARLGLAINWVSKQHALLPRFTLRRSSALWAESRRLAAGAPNRW